MSFRNINLRMFRFSWRFGHSCCCCCLLLAAGVSRVPSTGLLFRSVPRWDIITRKAGDQRLDLGSSRDQLGQLGMADDKPTVHFGLA